MCRVKTVVVAAALCLGARVTHDKLGVPLDYDAAAAPVHLQPRAACALSVDAGLGCRRGSFILLFKVGEVLCGESGC